MSWRWLAVGELNYRQRLAIASDQVLVSWYYKAQVYMRICIKYALTKHSSTKLTDTSQKRRPATFINVIHHSKQRAGYYQDKY